MVSLKGQTALITGGGRGVGRGIARALSALGAAVAVDDVYRDDNGVSAAEVTVREIEEAGGAGLALAEDVTTSDGAQRMVDLTVEQYGRIDILINCAGNYKTGFLHEIGEGDWDSVINLHLKGHFLSCKMAIPHMIKQDYGRIVTVASRGAFYHLPPSKQVALAVPPGSRPYDPPCTSYSAAKAGILGMTMSLAAELWPTGVTVNCLLPSANTQLFPGTGPRLSSPGGVPAGISMDPEDVAPAVTYLCSPEAADISGKIMYASGGDVIFFGDQLDMNGTRMIRKFGRWTVDELADVVPSLLGIPARS